MSKLAMVRQYRYSPAAGGLFSFLKPVVSLIGKGIGLIGKSKAAQVVATAAKSPVGQAAIYTGAGMVASKLMSGPGGQGATGGWAGARRRSKGITARELRGYRKVARLLHQEGMVSRRARGRK